MNDQNVLIKVPAQVQRIAQQNQGVGQKRTF